MSGAPDVSSQGEETCHVDPKVFTWRVYVCVLLMFGFARYFRLGQIWALYAYGSHPARKWHGQEQKLCYEYICYSYGFAIRMGGQLYEMRPYGDVAIVSRQSPQAQTDRFAAINFLRRRSFLSYREAASSTLWPQMAHAFVHRFGPPSPSWDSGLRRAGLILGACVASLLSIGVLLMFLQPALPAPSPASILPAGRTLALFPSLTAERLRDFTGLFPMLSAISPHDGVAIALVEYSCGPSCTDIGRVSLSEQSLEGSEKIGNWYVVSPSPALTSLLSATATGRLITDASFQSTMMNRDTDIYLSPGALPSSPNLTDRMLIALLQEANAIALGETNSGWTLTVSGTPSPLTSSVASSIVSLPGEILTLTVGDAGDLWKKWEENLDAAQKRILYSLVGGEVARYLGPNVSFTYDVLPLLQKPAVLHLAKNGSGVQFAITGSTDDRTGMITALERMEESVHDSLPQTSILARSFDENFSSVLIKQEAALLDTQEVTQDSWKLRSVFHKETNQGIVTAFSADRFAISNDFAFLSTVLNNAGERIALGSAIAGGTMDLTALRSEITSTPWKQALLGPVLRYDGSLTWHIERDGDVTTVSFQKR